MPRPSARRQRSQLFPCRDFSSLSRSCFGVFPRLDACAYIFPLAVMLSSSRRLVTRVRLSLHLALPRPRSPPRHPNTTLTDSLGKRHSSHSRLRLLVLSVVLRRASTSRAPSPRSGRRRKRQSRTSRATRSFSPEVSFAHPIKATESRHLEPATSERSVFGLEDLESSVDPCTPFLQDSDSAEPPVSCNPVVLERGMSN